MASTDDAILQALATLTEEVRDGIREAKDRDETAAGRIAKVERDITRIKTLWSVIVVVGAFVIHALKDFFLTAWTPKP